VNKAVEKSVEKQAESVSSVNRIFAILQALGETQVTGITDLSQKVSMPKSTVFRMLQTLKALGYVSQEEDAEKYGLTIKLFELGAKALHNVDLVKFADVQMQELSKLTRETVHLGEQDEGSIIYVHKVDGMYNLRMHSRIGNRNPLYSTAIGKVLMAWRSEDEVRQMLDGVEFRRSTPNTMGSVEEVLSALPRVKAQGFGEDNEEQEPGLRCIGVPVFNRFGRVIAGLSISYPTMRGNEDTKRRYVGLLQRAGRTISEQLGWHDYPAQTA
jgi:IclR family KDG regulon transcriptional repressor